MHSLNIVYRDLKPENIMVNKSGYITLVDLGFAKKVSHKTYTLCGTMDYVAPEIFTKNGYTVLVDMWSFGVCLWEFAQGKSPFWDVTTEMIKHRVIHEQIHVPTTFPRELQCCIKSVLERNVCIRKTSQSSRWNSFFRSFDFDKLESQELESPIKYLVNV